MKYKVNLLEEHYKNNRDLLVNLYKRKCGSYHDAEDIVHEAYTKALTYIDRYRESESIGSWISRIVYNEFLDFLHRSRYDGMTIEFNQDNYDPIDGRVEKKHLVSQIINIINSEQNESHRDVLNYYFCCNYKLEEIATITSLTKSNIRQIIYRFKEKIREVQ